MDRALLIYSLYMLVFAVLVGATLAVPLLAFGGDMSGAYAAFGPLCHQKLSRSLCVFSGDGGYRVADCTPQEGMFLGTGADRAAVRVETDGSVGYKMPLCSRDFGLYGAMLLAGAAYPFVRRLDDTRLYPAALLILSLVPIGLDGGVQLVSELGFLPFLYESTNLIRLITGAIAGAGASFFAIPLLVNMFRAEKKA